MVCASPGISGSVGANVPGSIQMVFMCNQNNLTKKNWKGDSHIFYACTKFPCLLDLCKVFGFSMKTPFLDEEDLLLVKTLHCASCALVLLRKQACLGKNCRVLKLNYHNSCLYILTCIFCLCDGGLLSSRLI